MKRLSFIVAIILALGAFIYLPAATESLPVAQAAQLVVTTTPGVLTAGVVSELVDSSSPLTFKVVDASGKPIDLTSGGAVEASAVWNNLFKDPYPTVLPQYYWLRFDLHNDDGTDINNKRLFNLNPIEIDFSRASEGLYAFRGFCANDVGEFQVTIYTPDRKLFGVTTVKVRAPLIDYAIFNIEDPEKRIFHTPGDPDFVMTAADNRVYGITATVHTAEGKLIRGITEGVRTCSSYTQARLTVGTTMLGNFYASRPTVAVALDPISGKNLEYVTDWGDRYLINLGIDYNRNGTLDPLNKEIYDIGWFHLRNWNAQTLRWEETFYYTYYNTTCTMYDDGTFATGYHFDYTDQTVGWGMGCIYNSPYAGCYLWPDINDDKVLDYRDALGLNAMGQAEFYIFANDVCGITCLVGVNHYGTTDFAGGGPRNEADPQDVRKRYKADGTFMLDMDGFVAFNVSSGRQITSQIVADVKMSPEKPEVGIPTTCDVMVTAKRDSKPVDRARVQINGAGVLLTDYTGDDGKAHFEFTPQKQGKITVTVTAGNFGNAVSEFPVKKDDTPPVLVIDDLPLLTRFRDYKVTGSTEPGSKVTVDGVQATVGADGRFMATIELGEGDNAITIVATDQSENNTRKVITITLDSTPPEITIGPVDPKIINAVSYSVTGNVSESCKVTVAGKDISTSSTFAFDLPATFGPNEYEIVATDMAGNMSKIKVEFVNYHKTTILLKVGSTEMMVDGTAKLLSIAPFIERNTTMVPLRAISEAFGATVSYDAKTKSIEIVLGNTQVIMQIGYGTMIVNGKKIALPVPPVIKSGSTFIPFRVIAEAFNCDVKWASETKEITIERLWY